MVLSVNHESLNIKVDTILQQLAMLWAKSELSSKAKDIVFFKTHVKLEIPYFNVEDAMGVDIQDFLVF